MRKPDKQVFGVGYIGQSKQPTWRPWGKNWLLYLRNSKAVIVTGWSRVNKGRGAERKTEKFESGCVEPSKATRGILAFTLGRRGPLWVFRQAWPTSDYALTG